MMACGSLVAGLVLVAGVLGYMLGAWDNAGSGDRSTLPPTSED